MKNSPFPPKNSGARAPRVAVRGRALRALAALCLGAVAALASAAPPPPADAAQAVEKRIGDLHTRLHIDASQEAQWQIVAQTMRDNQHALEPLLAEREKNAPGATAMQDLDSFAAISEAHASGIRRFIAVFEPLYAAMPAAQKKDADTLFRAGPGKMAGAK